MSNSNHNLLPSPPPSLMRAQRYPEDSPDEGLTRTTYVFRAGYSFLRTYPTHPRQHSNAGYNLETVIEAHNSPSVVASLEAHSALVHENVQLYVPPMPIPSYSRDMHSGPVLRHLALTYQGANSIVHQAALVNLPNSVPSVFGNEQRPYGDNLFASESHDDSRAERYNRSLGSRESLMVVTDSPSPERDASPTKTSATSVPSVFSNTSSSSNAPTSPESSGAHLAAPNLATFFGFGDSDPSLPLTFPTPRYSLTSPGHHPPPARVFPESAIEFSGTTLSSLRYYYDTATAPLENIPSYTTHNSAIPSPTPLGSSEYEPTSLEYYGYITPENGSASTTSHWPAPSLPEPTIPYPTTSAFSRSRSWSQFGTGSAYIDLATQEKKQLESELSLSQDCSDEEEDMIDEEIEAVESPEIWLTWVEVRVDRGSEHAEDAEAQE